YPLKRGESVSCPQLVRLLADHERITQTDLIPFVERVVERRAERMGLIVMLAFARQPVLVVLERIHIGQANRRLLELPIQIHAGAYLEAETLAVCAGRQRAVRNRLIIVVVKSPQR